MFCKEEINRRQTKLIDHTFSLLECADVTAEFIYGLDVLIFFDTIEDNTSTGL